VPELPDITVYCEAIARRCGGRVLERVAVRTPFLVRTVDPPLSAAEGRTVTGTRRIGKRIVVELDGDLFLVLHLMIAGRLRWKAQSAKPPGKVGLAAFQFPHGTLVLTEQGTKRRASLHVVAGAAGLAQFDRGGLEVLDADIEAFRARLRAERHTLKRALTDPRLFSGIGNAYGDEILHRARLSPVTMTDRLTDLESLRLYDAACSCLSECTDRLRAEVGEGFPDTVTAFRHDFAAHGRFGKRCPACGAKIQRIRYAENETNYCPGCQTGGKLLADRSLSRLLKDDWPRTPEALDELRGG